MTIDVLKCFAVLFGIVIAIVLGLYVYKQHKRRQREQVYKQYMATQPRVPAIIHQTWKTSQLPDNFAAWSHTWMDHNPDFKYMFWSDDDLRRFVKTEYPQYLDLYDGFDKHIKRVDMVRYLILHHYGGVYADMDFECVRPIRDAVIDHNNKPIVLGRMGDDETFEHSLPNALMASAPGHPFWLDVVDMIHARRNDTRSRVEYVTGPVLLKDAYDRSPYRNDICVRPSIYFYANNWANKVNWDEMEALWKSDPNRFRRAYPKCFALTYWTHTWE